MSCTSHCQTRSALATFGVEGNELHEGQTYVAERNSDILRCVGFGRPSKRHQLLHSPMCTDDMNEADLFFVPAFRTHPQIPCPKPRDVYDFVAKTNPRMRGEGAEALAARHIIVESRVELCPFFSSGGPSAKVQFKRWNLEVQNGIPFALDEYFIRHSHLSAEMKTTDLHHRNRPYSFPYPTIYHGAAASTPAALRPRGFAQFLWTYLGTNHFRELRRLAETECKLAPKSCFYPGKPEKSHHRAGYAVRTAADCRRFVEGNILH